MVAARLREVGYATECFGKWHLGMDWAIRPDDSHATRHPRCELGDGEAEFDHIVDFARPIGRVSTMVGFDTWFGVSASLDMSPYVFIEDDRVTTQKPFFLYLPVNGPHTPVGTTSVWIGRSDRATSRTTRHPRRYRGVLPERQSTRDDYCAVP